MQFNEVNLAPKHLRLVNFLVDGCVVWLTIVLFVLAVPELDLVRTLWFFGYFFFWEKSSGKTLGKYVTRTIAVMDDGAKLTTRAVFYRTITRFISLEVLSFLFFKNGHGAHDVNGWSRVVLESDYNLFLEHQARAQAEEEERLRLERDNSPSESWL